MEEGPFKVVPYVFSYVPVIVKTQASPAEIAFLKRAVLAYRADDEFYTRKAAADPGIGAISEDYVLINFYCDFPTAEEYVAWLNSVYEQTILDLGFTEGLDS